MRWHLAALLLLSFSVYAEAMRVRSTGAGEEEVITSHGTCVAIDARHIITAAHVVGRESIRVEIAGKWEPAKLVASDKDLDIALLTVDKDVVDFHELMEFPVLTMWASRGILGPGEKVSGGREVTSPPERQEVALLRLDVGGEVHDANSGAPIMVNDSVVAIVVRREWADKPRYAVCVPACAIKAFLAKAGWKPKGER